jgi:hypothetical protein
VADFSFLEYLQAINWRILTNRLRMQDRYRCVCVGPAQDNILQARRLIEDTIRQEIPICKKSAYRRQQKSLICREEKRP